MIRTEGTGKAQNSFPDYPRSRAKERRIHRHQGLLRLQP